MNGETTCVQVRALVPENLCRAHLQRLLSSLTFARAAQLRHLLSWLGEMSLRPNALPLAEKEIGEAALGRMDFDPQADSLVRKEMRRLRDKIKQYYDQEGARDRIRLIAAGGYLFKFVWFDPAHWRAADANIPCVLVLPLRAVSELNGQAVDLFEEILVRLGQIGGVQMIAPTTAFSYRSKLGDVRDFAQQCGADIVVEGNLAADDADLRLTLWFADGHTGRVGRPGRFAAAEVEQLAQIAANWLHEQALDFGYLSQKTWT
jgi:TolB-like protein